VEEYFDVASDIEDWNPRYNVAPTQMAPVIRQHPQKPERDFSLMRWGLIPSWAKDSSSAARMINARSETAATLPAFRDAFRLRRCLIPADGFYEWQRTGNSKRPFCFEVNDGELFAFAGLWDRWRSPDGEWITFSILTTTPNVVTSTIHDRMPVIVAKEDYDLWLDPGLQNPAAVSDLLKPFGRAPMRCYPVSDRINRVQNDDAECAAPITPQSHPQGQLFG
jgi:putative SOS response-associated peptidase YedK